MFRKSFVFTLIIVSILAMSVYGATAQEPQAELAGNAGCEAGSEYDPNCDVNRDGDMTVEDLSLVANHWGQAGVWTGAGDFWNLNGNTVADEAEAWVGTWNEHPIVFKTNGVERLRITTDDKLIIGRNTIVIDNQNDTITASSGTLSFDDENLVTMGNVGIGLPRSVSPERLLHLRRSIGGGGLYQRIEAEDRPADVGIEFASRGTVESIIQMNTSQANLEFYTGTPSDLAYPAVVIDNVGNVGIGLPRAVPPERLLHLHRSIGGGGLYQRIEAEDRPADVGIEFASRGTVESIIQMNTNQANLEFYTGTPSDLAHPAVVIDNVGNVGIGIANPQTKLDVAGRTKTSVLEITGGSDLAEPFEIAGTDKVEPGMVVAIDPAHPGQLRIADQAYDRTVAGCVSGAGGVNPGLVMQQEGSVAAGSFPVALSGRVYCWADASYGAIKAGDLLTTSDTAGHAMKATDYLKAQGAIIGKAMSALEAGQGLVLVLVSLQ